MRSANSHEMPWKKSSHSAANGDCIEVAHLPDDYVWIRDSKNPSKPPLRFTPAEWRTFVEEVKRNCFDLA
jgi:Domain of unknown function (DUF397)